MLSRIVAGAAITLCAVAASARPSVAAGCQELRDSSKVCVLFVGCLGENGAYFTGRALGCTEGTLAVQTSVGVFCSGEWVSRNFLGVGQASFTCDNEETGVAVFTYQDKRTGTATGQGMTSHDRKLKVWTGDNIRQFLAFQSGNIRGDLLCSNVAVPIG